MKNKILIILLCAIRLSVRAEERITTASTSVVTNDHGIITKVFIESIVSTNGSFVTERQKETRTDTNAGGALLETSTSERVLSYTIGNEREGQKVRISKPNQEVVIDSFLGMQFGVEYLETNEEGRVVGTMLQVPFKPKRLLEGFDEYILSLTPKSRQIAEVLARSQKFLPFEFDGNHYLFDAMERRYGVRPELWSSRHPILPSMRFGIFDGKSRNITIFFAGEGQWKTVIKARDVDVCDLAIRESQEIENQRREAARLERERNVQSAADAF